MGLLALGGLWMAYVACLYLTGHSVTATVTGRDADGFCDVVWQDGSGVERSGEGECYDDEPIGSSLAVRVSGWPDPGDPDVPNAYLSVALVGGLPLVAAGVAGLRYQARRVAPAPELATPTASEAGLPAAGSVQRTAVALVRAGRRGWGLLASGLLGVGTAVALVAVVDAADADLRDCGVTTIGTILSVDPGGVGSTSAKRRCGSPPAGRPRHGRCLWVPTPTSTSRGRRSPSSTTCPRPNASPSTTCPTSRSGSGGRSGSPPRPAYGWPSWPSGTFAPGSGRVAS